MLVTVVLLAGLWFAEATEAAEWDQARVTKLAQDFDSALAAVLEDPGTSPQQLTAFQQRKHNAALATLKRVQELSRELLLSLQRGEGKAASAAYLNGIDSLLSEVRALSAESWVTDSAQQRVAVARTALDELRAVYAD